ncbi:MAG: hypothetical protein WC227_04130 [Patescibacteria group bacterium]|jgi:hypothetical protein
MKYKVCDKCGEFVTKTGIISSSPTLSKGAGLFAKCRNIECGKLFSRAEYEKLKIEQF